MAKKVRKLCWDLAPAENGALEENIADSRYGSVPGMFKMYSSITAMALGDSSLSINTDSPTAADS